LGTICGGNGTLIASFVNLITLRLFDKKSKCGRVFVDWNDGLCDAFSSVGRIY